MKNRYLCLVTAISAFLWWGNGNAFAIEISRITAPPTLVYSPDAVVQSSGRISLANEGYTGPYVVTFTQLSLLPAPASPAEGLVYGLFYPDTAPTNELSLDGTPAAQSETLTGSFPPGWAGKNRTLDIGFTARVFPSSLPPPGTYTARITASLYKSSYPATGSPSDTMIFTVTVTVRSITDLSLVPVGAPFSIPSTTASMAFGTLVANASRSVDLMVRSNVRYSFSFMSVHGGALANDTDGMLLSYDIAAEGFPLTLQPGIPSLQFLNSTPTYSASKRYELSVTIAAFEDFPTEGTYSDFITITVLAP